MKPAIEETVRQAVDTQDIEIIEVPAEGDRRVLLRVKHMPEYAFLVWAEINTTTLSQIVFRMPNNGYSAYYAVLCACCSSETSGLDLDAATYEEKATLAKKFSAAVIQTCHTHGITNVFMRKADKWGEHYGDKGGIAFVEASRHEKAMQELYGRKPIEDALKFIDYLHGRGLSGSR